MAALILTSEVPQFTTAVYTRWFPMAKLLFAIVSVHSLTVCVRGHNIRPPQGLRKSSNRGIHNREALPADPHTHHVRRSSHMRRYPQSRTAFLVSRIRIRGSHTLYDWTQCSSDGIVSAFPRSQCLHLHVSAMSVDLHHGP